MGGVFLNMTFDIQTFILGAVQGLCEFLPISSSGHLALLQIFFGYGSESEKFLAFDLLLHCATMLVVLIFFWREIVRLAAQWFSGCVSAEARKQEGWAWGWYILAGTVMTAIVGLPLKNIVEQMMSSPLAVGCGLLATAGLLTLVPLLANREGHIHSPRTPLRGLKIALIVGLVQGIAVLPGVSRSGSTIAAGLIMGLAVDEAFRFSFLLSIPAVLGASLLEAVKLFRASGGGLPIGWFWAIAAAFVMGWIALKLMHRLVLSGRWAYFGLYCVVLGSIMILSSLEIF